MANISRAFDHGMHMGAGIGMLGFGLQYAMTGSTLGGLISTGSSASMWMIPVAMLAGALVVGSVFGVVLAAASVVGLTDYFDQPECGAGNHAAGRGRKGHQTGQCYEHPNPDRVSSEELSRRAKWVDAEQKRLNKHSHDRSLF